jgi:hypothetical protein
MPLFLRVLLVTKIFFLLQFEPLMSKGVSEVDLHNAPAAFSREVVACRTRSQESRYARFSSAWSFFVPIR